MPPLCEKMLIQNGTVTATYTHYTILQPRTQGFSDIIYKYYNCSKQINTQPQNLIHRGFYKMIGVRMFWLKCPNAKRARTSASSRCMYDEIYRLSKRACFSFICIFYKIPRKTKKRYNYLIVWIYFGKPEPIEATPIMLLHKRIITVERQPERLVYKKLVNVIIKHVFLKNVVTI